MLNSSLTSRLWQLELALMLVFGAVFLSPTHGQAPPAQDQVKFRLGLPDRLKFVETRTVHKLVDVGDGKPTEETRSQLSDIEFAARGAGFVVSVKPRPVREWEQPGKEALGFASALRSLRLQYEFDGSGKLTAVRGLETVRQEIASAIPAPLKPMLDPLLKRAIEEMKEEWSSRYGPLVGATYGVGYRQQGTAPMPLGEDLPSVNALWVRGIKGRQKHEGKDLVYFLMGYTVENADGYGEAVGKMLRDSLAQALAIFAATNAKGAAQAIEAAMPKLKVTELFRLVERFVDPQTMMVYQEKQTKGFKISDGSREMNWVEVTEIDLKPVN